MISARDFSRDFLHILDEGHYIDEGSIGSGFEGTGREDLDEAIEKIRRIYDDVIRDITLEAFDLIEEAKDNGWFKEWGGNIIPDTFQEHVKDKFTGAYPDW